MRGSLNRGPPRIRMKIICFSVISYHIALYYTTDNHAIAKNSPGQTCNWTAFAGQRCKIYVYVYIYIYIYTHLLYIYIYIYTLLLWSAMQLPGQPSGFQPCHPPLQLTGHKGVPRERVVNSTHSNYKTWMPCIVIYCHYLPVSGLGNLRACCLP